MSPNFKEFFKSNSVGRVALLPYRMTFAASYLQTPIKNALSWLVASREYINLTYDLDELNIEYLAAFVAHVTQKPVAEITGYISEIQDDGELREHVRKHTRSSHMKAVADPEVRYGRRIGWYAIIRALKPKVVVETGVEKGLGSCVIAAALIKNASEGFAGKSYGTDINPKAGFLLRAPYDQRSEILFGDSIESLEGLREKIDLFINDSDHSGDYEAREYEVVAGKLAPGAIIIGDNAHVTDRLLRFAAKTGRQFLYFQEKPQDHWYPGAGVGVAF